MAAAILVLTIVSFGEKDVLLQKSLQNEIQRDLSLLKKQQEIVDRTENILVSAYKAKQLKARKMDKAKKIQRLDWYPTDESEHRPAAVPWQEGMPGQRSYSVERFVNTHGPQDLAKVDGDKVADWNEFFNNMNVEVDAPRWDKTGMIVDNIEAIPACSVDCDKEGTDDDKDFAFYSDLNAINGRGHIVDNLDNIDACDVDC
uniref:Uncharacterized protein n=1 Tax=Hanusia phi TaxID=3032 RepID=A0A7S0EU24_9CRYP